MKPLDFVYDFIKFYENTGIYDEYDAESNKMKTSAGVERLYALAKTCVPDTLKPKQAATKMRELSPEMRDKLIREAEEEKIIDLRTEFARRMSENGGARGILAQLLQALESEDHSKAELLLKDAEGIVKGPENVN